MELAEYAYHSRTSVSLERPERYAKQLLHHLSHKAELQEDQLTFEFGVGRVITTETSVELEAYSDTDKMLEKIQNVLARHLLKFAKMQDQSVWWSRVTPAEL